MIEVSAEEHWKAIIDAAVTLEDFNNQIVRFMLERGPVYVQMVASEAKRRGYVVERIGENKTGRYAMPRNMRPTRGHNLIAVDWQDGTLYCEFASSPKVYDYPDCPEAWCINLLNSPYPDSLWAGYKKKIDARTQERTLSGVS